jgi:hypothetical protein
MAMKDNDLTIVCYTSEIGMLNLSPNRMQELDEERAEEHARGREHEVEWADHPCWCRATPS